MKKLSILFSIFVLAMVLGIFAGAAFAEIPRGEYDIEVDGVTIEGMSFLVTENISGNAGCIQIEASTFCTTHAWNGQTNFFIYDGMVKLMLDHSGSGFLGESMITLRPICDGFSPEPAGCQ